MQVSHFFWQDSQIQIAFEKISPLIFQQESAYRNFMTLIMHFQSKEQIPKYSFWNFSGSIKYVNCLFKNLNEWLCISSILSKMKSSAYFLCAQYRARTFVMRAKWSNYVWCYFLNISVYHYLNHSMTNMKRT